MHLNDIPNKKSSHQSLSKIAAESMKYESPFAIPDDAEIFRIKEKEKDRKREEKQHNDKLHIWEKGVKKQSMTIKELNDLGKAEEVEDNYQSKASFIEAAKNAIKNRVKVNEPMHNFISKKRETLLFQMLIDHKREKINEFQELTKHHRKGLDRAEQMLEEDMKNFNSYLNENKKEARDAIKKAEMQTRKKNEKIALIKEKLELQADLTGKNMSKKETLQNLKKYKHFLQSLSPELTEEERRKRQEKIEGEEGNSFANAMMNYNDNLSESSEEEQFYFEKPEQLSSIFHSLEESNLFLITNLKEIEQETEQARTTYLQKKEGLSGKRNELVTSKNELLRQINQVDEEIEELKKTTNKDEISEFFAILESEIIRMSKENARDAGEKVVEQKNLSALDYLKLLESKIELQLRNLKEFKDEKPNLVRELEKNCISEKREKKKLKNEEELEEKAIKQKAETSPEREKRKGRPIMARSIIKKEEKKKEVEVFEPEEEIDRRKYLM